MRWDATISTKRNIRELKRKLNIGKVNMYKHTADKAKMRSNRLSFYHQLKKEQTMGSEVNINLMTTESERGTSHVVTSTPPSVPTETPPAPQQRGATGGEGDKRATTSGDHDDENLSISTTSSKRKKRDDRFQQLLEEQSAKHRAEMDLATRTLQLQLEDMKSQIDDERRHMKSQIDDERRQNNDNLIKLQKERDDAIESLQKTNFELQRSKDREIKQLNDKLELSQLELSVKKHEATSSKLFMPEDDDSEKDVNLEDFNLPSTFPCDPASTSDRFSNWLESTRLETSDRARQVRFEPEVSSVIRGGIASATTQSTRCYTSPTRHLTSSSGLYGGLPSSIAQQATSADNAMAMTARNHLQTSVGQTASNFIPSSSGNNYRAFATLEKSLPKLKLSEFSGDPLEWPEWSGMFQATIGKSNISSDEKMSHLKTLLTGSAKRAFAGMGYSGANFDNAWRTLQRKFGQPHVIVSSHLTKVSSFPIIRYQDSNALIEFADVISNFVNVLTEFGYTNDLFSSSNLEQAVTKLPQDVQLKWFAYIESTPHQNKLPNLVMFNEWLQHQAMVYERLVAAKTNKKSDVPKSDKPNTTGAKPKKFGNFNQNFGANENKKTTETSETKCPLDDGNHKIWHCEAFKKQNIQERYETVKKLKLCFSCLSASHRIKDCKARVCGIDGCEKRHNRLLHTEPKPKQKDVLPAGLASEAQVVTKGLLQVATVKVFGNNRTEDAKALCDSGSSQTWIDSSFAQSLGLDGEATTIHVAGIHGTAPMECERVTIKLGTTDGQLQVNVRANTHKDLSVGNSKYDLAKMKKLYPHLSCIKADNVDLAKVKMILGQDCFPLIRPLEYKSKNNSTPWAVKLPLGWVVSGPLPIVDQDNCVNTSVMMSEDFALGEQVRKWWEMESYGTSIKADQRSADDRKAHAILESTVRHVGDRYEVGLLWNDEMPTLPNNYMSALGQLRSLEARLKRDPDLADKYQATIDNDVAKGFARKLSQDELLATKDERQWYLPHHPVKHPHKPMKVRRVCNAAAKFKGVSLNDCLLTGPDLLNDLVGVLFRFREHAIAISADIDAMFMQVQAREADQRCLRFLWRDNDGMLQIYQYLRHIFGAKSSPTCVIFVLRRCAMDNADEFPAAANVVLECFYVDDLLKSLTDAFRAKTLCTDLQKLLAKGGFNLSQWKCNVKGVVPTSLDDDKTNEGELTTVLGLRWDHHEDKLEVCRGLKQQVRDNWTQREVLSAVSSVFDPLGILSPFIITARLILKEIWQTQGQEWDSEIDDELNERFKLWIEELNKNGVINIPRCYCSQSDVITRQLHVFGDASQEAFAAVCYMRTELTNGEIVLSYVIGKSRVAPKRFQTIPKLELMAALIATRLKNLVFDEHTLQFSSVHFWTDSSTVLRWINSHTKKHPVFVANRLAEIMDSSSIDQWRHVPGDLNPADIGTRGLLTTDSLIAEWLTGPAWLKLPEDNWPISPIISDTDDESLVCLEKATSQIVVWKRFSSFVKLKNTIGWMLKWADKDSQKGLTVSILQKAEMIIWRMVQDEAFPQEKTILENQHELPKTSRILKLLPFIDNNGVMRAQGRLRKAPIEYDAKHPIILPSSHYVSRLYLEYMHRRYAHEGTEYLRSIIQQTMWMIGLRNALRSVKHNCLDCKRLKTTGFEPIMADLPIERLDARVFPFQHTGVDYFGPLEVKQMRRIVKRWVCIFTCLVTRAVHFEIVPSLDTQACMTAIRRFIARRGQPATIVSDNGTNFVGAHKEFQLMFKELNQKHISDSLIVRGIKWKFNPPGAPHFGGIWERLIRSCKKAMFHVLGRQTLSDDVLQTVICTVKQLLNNRPLTANSSDPTDLEPLTPNHFLLGRSTTNYPYYIDDKEKTTINLQRSFRANEQLTQSIWDRWLREYLPKLNERQKWSKQTKSLAIGDLVWLHDVQAKKGHFPLARILDLHYGDDGVCRSAKIQTVKGTFIRPMIKLIPLEKEDVFIPENRAGDVGADSE